MVRFDYLFVCLYLMLIFDFISAIPSSFILFLFLTQKKDESKKKKLNNKVIFSPFRDVK